MLSYKSLRINLSTKIINIEPIDQQIVNDFVGGRGFAIYYLYRDQVPHIEPLSENNKVLFLAGPLAGTGALSTSRWMVSTKSPLTGAYARSVCGADFGAWLRFAGYEFIEVEGKSEKPVYIHLTPDSCQIVEAAELWGLDTRKTQEWLMQKLGKDTRIACIGPAAEKLVRYAGIFSERRSASRCGVGTVMGSKNLKGIAITAKRSVRVADNESFHNLIKEQAEVFRQSKRFQEHKQWGTTDTQNTTNKLGIFPVRNFRYGRMQGYEKILGSEYIKMRTGDFGCYACPARCGKSHTVSSGFYAGAHSEGPEYESIWAFTGPIGSLDINATVAADAICDDLGMDTISAGNCVGFAYELYEKGIITQKDTDGLELTYGNHGAMIELLRKIGNREGFGNVLAEGVMRAAKIIGKNAEDYAIHFKGMEPPAYDPRGAKSQGFNFCTSNIGASHVYGYANQEVFGNALPRKVDRFGEIENADIVVHNQNHTAMTETGIACGFSQSWGWIPGIFCKMLAASTGVKEFAEESYMREVGDRIINMERAFIVREGFDRAQDTFPNRMLKEPLRFEGSDLKGSVVKDLNSFLDRYYAIRDWDAGGVPTQKKLQELGLSKYITE
jgi:aldehyde:ferredoxin oxidoreductase